MAIVKLNADNFDAEVLASDNKVLVDFYADWCGPCKMMSPIIEEIANEADATLKVCKLNVDEASAVAGRYRVQSIPSLIVFEKGNVVASHVGAIPKDAVLKLLQK